jgi:hypothetical protein
MRIRGLDFSALTTLLTPKRVAFERPQHIFIALCDHFEPMWQRPARHVQNARVERWVREYPKLVAGLCDSIGRPPQHTFFYPGDEYDAGHIDQIAGLCRAGYGDVEVHLHHRHDSSASLQEKLESYVRTLRNRHGLLETDASGRITYGFIHGNWALDNSRPDGDWCGVNDEITILRRTGCYADFTMPSAPDPCQTTTINSIYYAVDDPHRPKSHNLGIAARVGAKPPDDGLLMIQGPLSLDWGSRKWGLLPRLENGELTGRRPASMRRFELWCRAGVGVAGRENWLFVKLHTHGAQEANAAMLLGEQMCNFHLSLRQTRSEDSRFKFYYVTAREMASLARQAERGSVVPALLPGAFSTDFSDETGTQSRLSCPATRNRITESPQGITAT